MCTASYKYVSILSQFCLKAEDTGVVKLKNDSCNISNTTDSV